MEDRALCRFDVGGMQTPDPEVEVACTGARSYPGAGFRIQRPGEFERGYLRSHRAGPEAYPDTVQGGER